MTKWGTDYTRAALCTAIHHKDLRTVQYCRFVLDNLLLVV